MIAFLRMVSMTGKMRTESRHMSDSHLVAVKKGFENAKAHQVDSAIAKQLENESNTGSNSSSASLPLLPSWQREDTRSKATPNCLGRRTMVTS